MSIKSTITRRYIVALLLVAASMTVSHLLMRRQTASNVIDGRLINISGMQRMLSQRIALMANELAFERDDSVLEKLAGKLQKSYDKMSANQSELNAANRLNGSSEILRLYYGNNGVDKRVTDYLALAEQMLTAYRSDKLAKAKLQPISRQIAKIARNGLLNQLDTVVTQHQLGLERKLEFIQRAELIVLAIGLTILLIEALFIFRPMAEQIGNAVKELESANNELTEFTYRISHDLRAPIASSLGMTRVISESIEDRDFDEAAFAVERVNNAMERLDALITDVIDVTKTKEADAKKESTPLRDLIERILEHNSHLPGFERLKIDVRVDPTASVFVEKIFLKQSLDNLISNAIKYLDTKESSPQLSIDAEVEGSQCTITVSDNGIGIPSDKQSELFGMFKRFHPRKSFGSGLGLYLVRQNINRLGGSILFEPLVKGSKFKIQFPLTAEAVLS